MSNGGKAKATYVSVLVWGLALAPAACSGRVDVGTEPGGGGSGAAAAGAGAAAGSGGTGNGAGNGSGGYPVGGSAGTTGMPDPPDPCDFEPNTLGSDPRPLLSSAEVMARLGSFLEDDQTFGEGAALPATPSAGWAAEIAEQILDAHADAETPAPGLTRFFTKWLGFSPGEDDLQVPARWSLALVASGATLSTLLTAEGDEPHRIGILNEREFLAAYPSISARGSWMSGNLLCTSVPPPPEGIHGAGESTGDTRRERHENLLTNTSPACTGCHELADPQGYSLEHFDELGDYRTHEGTHPIDASGTWTAAEASFDDYTDLAPQLAGSCQVARCFSAQLALDAFGLALWGSDTPLSERERNRVAKNFVDSGFSIRALVESIVRSPSFLR